MSNTGKKIYTALIEINSSTGLPTGRSKPNVPEDPDYIAPLLDYETCPVNTSTTTTTTILIGRRIICNLTNTTACSSTMCISGNQHMTLIYIASSLSIAPGTQLYYDELLTQPVLNQTWIRDINSDIIYAVSSTGIVLSEGSLTCSI